MKLSAVMNAAVNHVPRHYRPDCCIAATRILLDVFGRLNVPAAPLPVLCSVANAVMVREKGCWGLTDWISDEEADRLDRLGAYQMLLGVSPRDEQPGKWAGHLVCLAYGVVMIDLSLPQINRPAKGIEVIPLMLEVDPDWTTSADGALFKVGKCTVAYAPYPDAPRWEGSRDWWDRARRKPVVDAIVADALEELRR
jgi:hypothetical protein